MARLITIVLATLVVLVGCGSDSGNEGYVCTASFEPGIVLEVRDGATNEPLADIATAMVSSLTFTEQMTVCAMDQNGQGLLLCGAYERTGTYAISLRVDGYEPWNATGVVVVPASCHVATVQLAAEMTKIQ